MSMQISVDPAALSQEQREAVAGFILAYPGKACAGTCGHAVAEIHAHTSAPVVPAELEALQHDHESTMPEAAFGKPDEAAAAFGVPAAPLAVSTPVIAGASTVAPPPPANTAPTTTTPGVASSVAAASSGGVEVDKDGLPWDGRIHTESKTKNADGRWRKKRNFDATIAAEIEGQLRQVMEAPSAVPQPVAPPSVPAPPEANVTTPTPGVASSAVAAPVPPTVPQPPAPVAGAVPSMPAAPSAAPGEVPADARQQFVGLVGRTSAAIQAGKVTQAEVTQICAAEGVPALPLLTNRLDLVAQVAANIDALIASRQQ